MLIADCWKLLLSQHGHLSSPLEHFFLPVTTTFLDGTAIHSTTLSGLSNMSKCAWKAQVLSAALLHILSLLWDVAVIKLICPFLTPVQRDTQTQSWQFREDKAPMGAGIHGFHSNQTLCVGSSVIHICCSVRNTLCLFCLSGALPASRTRQISNKKEGDLRWWDFLLVLMSTVLHITLHDSWPRHVANLALRLSIVRISRKTLPSCRFEKYLWACLHR